MAIILMPEAGIRSISWRLPRHPSFAVRSQWTGKTQVVDLGATTGWRAQIEVAPRRLAEMQSWRAFFAACRGLANQFVVRNVYEPQVGFIGAMINGGGQAGSAIAIRGLPVSATVLPAGALLTIAPTTAQARLYTLTAPLVSNAAGIGTAAVHPDVRTVLADGAAVDMLQPYALMRLADPDTGYSDEPGGIFRPFAFECEEVI